jgi:hypothetical protein
MAGEMDERLPVDDRAKQRARLRTERTHHNLRPPAVQRTEGARCGPSHKSQRTCSRAATIPRTVLIGSPAGIAVSANTDCS